MVDCWKSNRFEYPELEEMFIINMAHHNNNPELLARELESTLRNSRFCLFCYQTCIKVLCIY